MGLFRRGPGGGIGVLLALGALLVACSSGGGPADAPDLAGKVFVATDVQGRDLVEGSTLRLTFDEDQLAAQAGCNTIFGGAAWDDGTLRFTGEPARTSMGCVDGLAEQDDWLAAFLTAAPSVELNGRTLTLDGGTGTITLEQE